MDENLDEIKKNIQSFSANFPIPGIPSAHDKPDPTIITVP